MTKSAVVKIGGTEFKISTLVLKQNRVVDRLLANNIAFFSGLNKDNFGQRMLEITEKQVDDFTEIVYVGLTREQPALTRAQFEDLPVSLPEIIAAVPIVMEMSGLFKKSDNLAREAIPGEAKAVPDPV